MIDRYYELHLGIVGNIESESRATVIHLWRWNAMRLPVRNRNKCNEIDCGKPRLYLKNEEASHGRSALRRAQNKTGSARQLRNRHILAGAGSFTPSRQTAAAVGAVWIDFTARLDEATKVKRCLVPRRPGWICTLRETGVGS
jgi:hypothetical protein